MTIQPSSIELLAQETFNQISVVPEYKNQIEEAQNQQDTAKSNLEAALKDVSTKIPMLLQLSGYEQHKDKVGPYYLRRQNGSYDLVRFDQETLMWARINKDDLDTFLKFDRNRWKSSNTTHVFYGGLTAIIVADVIFGIKAIDHAMWGQYLSGLLYVGGIISSLPVGYAFLKYVDKYDERHRVYKDMFAERIHEDNLQEGQYNALEKALFPWGYQNDRIINKTS